MKQLARYLMYAGVVAAVLGLSKVHARFVAPQPYSWHSSSRAAWSLAYIGLACLAAFGAGLPDLVRGIRSTVVAAVAAAVGAALAVSAIQLVVGDSLLPRFVVFGATLLLVPWYVACAALASG